MDRVLFYLPVVTPWWFDNKIAPLIRALSTVVETHVMVPPLWRNTGIGPEQLRPFMSGPSVHWHIVDDDDHPSLRTSPAEPDRIVDLVRSIEPTYVLCRSADVVTPSRFLGKLCHLMEAGSPPFAAQPGWVILQRDFWHHGIMADLTGEDRDAINQAFADTWNGMRNRVEHANAFRLPRVEALEQMGIPAARKVVALPLEYEHEEAFTSFHNRFERNLDLIHHLAERLDEDVILAMTDHPLNYKHVNNSAVYEAIRALGSRARLVPNPEARYFVTDLLIKHCDGLIVQNSKSIYSGAFFGKPILRLSHRPSAEWLGVHDDLESFAAAVRTGQQGPTEEQARLWFGYHLLHEIIDINTVSGVEILDRIDRPFSRDRLISGLDRIQSHERQLDLAA